MSEYKEQHPLLFDSDEESNISCPRRHRRSRYPAYGERSRARVNGAVFIIKHWPDHVSSLFKYWWIGFGMIAITIFIIYNSVSLIDVVKPTRLPIEAIKEVDNENIKIFDEGSTLDVFMHIFVKSYEEVDDVFYLKYIKEISKKFTDYRYNFIVVLNDIAKSAEKEISAETNNDIAMRTILNTDKVYHREHWSDISIKYISLSNYLDNSPVKEYWRNLSLDVLKFLTRCIAIWDKGGIAFNPTIITPQSPNFNYMENLQNTFTKYRKTNNKYEHKENKNTNKQKMKKMPKVNNIRDIINILENDNNESGNIPQYNLSEAEDREEPHYIKMTKHHDEDKNNRKFKRELVSNVNNSYNLKFSNENLQSDISGKNNQNSVTESSENENTITNPLFWDLIFRNSSQTLDYMNDKLNKPSFESPGESDEKLSNITAQKSSTVKNNLDSLINTSSTIMHLSKPELTVDLKGNLIATKTSCHAFIGTIFSSIKHYSSIDTIKDIITEQLSIFCKGKISSCKYIDVILL